MNTALLITHSNVMQSEVLSAKIDVGVHTPELSIQKQTAHVVMLPSHKAILLQEFLYAP